MGVYSTPAIARSNAIVHAMRIGRVFLKQNTQTSIILSVIIIKALLSQVQHGTPYRGLV